MLLTELKAAAVDVACVRAVARGADVVFVDNRPSSWTATRTSTRRSRSVLDLAIARAGSRTAGRASR